MRPPPGTTATVVREVERKFRVHEGFQIPELAAGCGASVDARGTAALTATYHDTGDLRLAREGITLRRRTGGDDDGWHLKIPVRKAGKAGRIGVRDEIRLPLDSARTGQPPAELLGLVAAVVRGETVRPVATLRSVRTTRVLRDAAGRPVAELVDDVVSLLDGPAAEAAGPATEATAGAGRDTASPAAPRFRELELELLTDPGDELAVVLSEQVSADLIAAGAIPGEFVAKAVRALGPTAAAPPEVPEPPEVGPADVAQLAVIAHLRRHVRALRAEDVLVRRNAEDAVHQMRVAARRLRSGLQVFRPLLDRQWADALRDELRWVAATLGDYRDAEVLLARLERRLDSLPADQLAAAEARTVIRRRLHEQMRVARHASLEMLDSPRYLRLHDELVAAANEPRTTAAAELPCGQVLTRPVSKAYAALAKKVNRLLVDEEGGLQAGAGGAPDEEWHETRITAKRARYAVDACTQVFGEPAAALGKQLSRVTEVLGEHQDGAVAAQTLHQLASSTGVTTGVADILAVLQRAERDAVSASRAAFADIWEQASARRWRLWMEE